MNFRIDLEWKFSLNVAQPVVPDPAKKSRMIESGFEPIAMRYSIRARGLGLLKTKPNSCISLVP